MKPAVSEENLGREGSRNIKDNIAEKDTRRKLEISRMRKPAESDIRESSALSKLVDRDIKSRGNKEEGRSSCAGTESVRRLT